MVVWGVHCACIIPKFPRASVRGKGWCVVKKNQKKRELPPSDTSVRGTGGLLGSTNGNERKFVSLVELTSRRRLGGPMRIVWCGCGILPPDEHLVQSRPLDTFHVVVLCIFNLKRVLSATPS
jgi:hypothetical protein